MFATAIRFFASKPKLKPSRYGVPWYGSGDAQGSCYAIWSILEQHGPLRVSDCWTHAEQAGIKSKRHMKLLLRWMKEQQRVRVICNHLSQDKTNPHTREFIYSAVVPKSADKNAPQ